MYTASNSKRSLRDVALILPVLIAIFAAVSPLLAQEDTTITATEQMRNDAIA